MILKLDSHHVWQARGAAEALEIFEPGKFDLVLTDFFMPGMHGDELASALKKLAPNLSIIMFTADPEKLQGLHVPLANVDLLIPKPCEIQTLREAVAKFAPAQRLGFSS